ncbi:Protein SAP1 [Meyerozyma sp. JA9]|nr:Protein SAP1 [Meyerozyma sp. JA9]
MFRRKPPVLSPLEELQQTYDDCCNITIRNLAYEDSNRVADALKGWKSLHTSILYKIDSFDKQKPKLTNEELQVLEELKAIRDENVKHLIRVQLRVDELNRKAAAKPKTSVAPPPSQTSSMTIPSLRNTNTPQSRSLTNGVGSGHQRSLLKSLRPQAPSRGLSEAASKAATVSWSKPQSRRSSGQSTGQKAAKSSEDLFADFDQSSITSDDPNWEKVDDSPLIDLDDSKPISASHLDPMNISTSMNDLSLKKPSPPPPPRSRNAKSEVASKSAPDVSKTYIYKKPQPINVNNMMKMAHQKSQPPNKPVRASKSPIRQPKPANNTPAKIQTKPKPKSSNITYNYVTEKNSSPPAQPKPDQPQPQPPRIPKLDDPTSPTMDDILGGYDGEPISQDEEFEQQRAIISSIKGIDEMAGLQILNDIVVRGDEVHWDDIVGLEGAKNSLKEAVVYPFLRPDLFKGLREPTRGMLLFGPPGTGKTMLARAVATESKSTFFSISSSSLTSKYLGESEKLVKALFLVARKLAPSIVFIDEIDSLLSSRSDGENDSTRRIKNEFLIQWSELSSAAAGRDHDDVSRVLILGATNLPWSIDEAARRRFVRRQYIPLPEPEARKNQIEKLLRFQKHTLSDADYEKLMSQIEGFSGSDITALAKDAAMGPLRALGDKLLQTPPDQIRPINLSDFESSLLYIRPSVSSEGLQQYEEWATKFGSSGA